MIPTNETPVAIDDLHPWLGLASFSEETRGYFYGREEEVGELARRVQRKLLTVLFGQSGLGKTSILRAGIVPRLRAQGYCPVYVRMDYGPGAPAPTQQIRMAIADAAEVAGGNSGSNTPLDDESLWEFLHHRGDVLTDADGKPLIPLLIFDQFEEIFTLAQGDAGGRERAAAFVDSLAELVENRPSRALEARLEEDDSAVERFDFARCDYRILITLREDYLAHLEGLKAAMPSITQNRMRLAPMTGQQALAAVTGPGGALVSTEVAEAIVRFVAGGAELAHAQVEPSLLSLICRELNDKRIAAGRATITLDLLAGSHASILADFYERALFDQPEAVRSVVEDVLLTDSGYRENVAEERVLRALAGAGAAPDALAVLVNRRLLRIEERLDVRRVELTHDVLCSVVAASRAQRLEREAQASSARQLAEQQERELRTRRSLVRSRRVAAVSLLLAAIAVASTVFGYIKLQESRQTRLLAETSRGDAEKLVGYLLEDFHAELEPVGRLDMVGELASRTVDYYRSLAPSMRNSGTDSNHALALLRLGDVRRVQGKRDEAIVALDQATAMLEPLLASGAATAATRLTLASTLHARGMAAYSNGEEAQAMALTERSVTLSQPLSTAADGSLKARRVHAASVTRIGYMKMRGSDMDGAEADFRSALSIVDIGDAVATDMATAIVHSDTSAWMQELLGRFKQDYDGAEKFAVDALAVAGKVLAQRPNHATAMNIIERIHFNRASAFLDVRQPGRSLAALTEAEVMGRAMLGVEPGNQGTIDTLAIILGFRSQALEALGRPREAITAAAAAFALYADKAPSAYQSNNLSNWVSTTSDIHAELGDVDAITRLQALNTGFIQARAAGLASDPQAQRADELWREMQALYEAQVAGDAAATPAAAASLVAKVQAAQALAPSGQTPTVGDLQLRYLLVGIGSIAGAIAYDQGDAAGAEAAYREVLARNAQEKLFFSERFVNNARSALALALVQLDRLPEARTLLAESLTSHDARMAAGSDDQWLRIDRAITLYGVAQSRADGGPEELAEARALMASLPAEMQAYRTVRKWRGRIGGSVAAASAP